jgi:hypothetical protein
MKKREQTQAIKRKTAAPQTPSKRWRTYALMFACSLMMVSGIFFAGRQHFSSMDYGMKNSKLRSQVAQLEAEKKRLLLAREISLSPMELKKAAKKIGINYPAAEGIVAQVVSSTKEKAAHQAPAVDPQPLVIKTAAVALTTTGPAVEKADLKVAKVERPAKKTTIAAE